MEKMLDLRSDTVTTPTEKMRDAMRNAQVGDDVMGEDPTVNRLQELSAELFGTEAALFVGSGTMANQVAVLTSCSMGDQIIVHDNSHIYNLEVGGLASTCGVQTRAIPAPGGRFDLERLQAEIHLADIQRAPTTLICLENTFDLNRGLVICPEETQKVVNIAKKNGIKTHLDGARVLNAAVSLDKPVSELCDGIDSVALCLSKALACPVGSLLMGSSDFIKKATRMRQRLGGGWRQAGVLAAAGIVAFEEMIGRLGEDHENARQLAQFLKELGLGIDMEQVQSNIIFIDTEPLNVSAVRLSSELANLNIKVKVIGEYALRAILHKDIATSDLETVRTAFNHVIKILK